MHIAIRRYQVDPAAADEITRQVREGFLPLISKAPGFVDYYWMDAGKQTMVSVSIFETEAGAQESIRMAANYIRDHLAALLPNPPEVIAGSVLVHSANQMREVGR